MYDRVCMSRPSRLSMFAGISLGFCMIPALAQGKSPAKPPALQFETLRREGRTYVVATDDGGRAELTLDPRLQESTEEVLKAFQIPYGAAVVLSIPDGRVLAMVGHSSVDPQLGPRELALQAWAPAASVFKVVSAAALVSEGGLSASSRTCYHGGVSSILPDNLVDLPIIDKRCDTLGYGLGKSQNAILAKLATRHLTAEKLARVGRAFGFGQEIPFELPVEPSHLDVPVDSPLEFARTAAGFWHSTLSTMHGALLAAAIADHGEMPVPTLIDRAFGPDGRERAAGLTAAAPRRVVTMAAAREVGQMMELTTRIGTAKGTFRDKHGRRYLPIEVAGKTGTLSAQTDKGYVGYSWFIGYAPADHPTVAFAVVLGNQSSWRIKATYLGRRIVTEYLAERGDRIATRILAAR
jgi:peptidoglycan glycosyltransferase